MMTEHRRTELQNPRGRNHGVQVTGKAYAVGNREKVSGVGKQQRVRRGEGEP